MASVRVVMAADAQENIDLMAGEYLATIADAIAVDAVQLAPMKSGDLKRSIKATRVSQLTWRIGAYVSYAAAVELGASPHIIRAHGDYSLVTAEGVFMGREVLHPGNPAQPYLRPALFKKR